MSVLPDAGTDFGARVRRRLDTEKVIWLVTVNSHGVPQPNPVWFLFDADADSLVIYNDHNARRLASIDAHPQVAANFDGDSNGGDIVVLTGELRPDSDIPASNRNQAYLAKYGDAIGGIGMDPASFAEKYSVPLRLRISRVRGH
jgi:PPOX class probable F420-dependent enzyme